MVRVVVVLRLTALGNGLVNLENDGTPRTGWPNSQLSGAYLHHVSRLQTCANLAAPVDAHSPTTQRRNPQPTEGARGQYSVTVIDPRCGELQMLIGPAADGQAACMEKNPPGRRVGVGRASDGSLVE